MNPANPYMIDIDGQAVAFDTVYDLYFDRIFNYILRRTANVSEAEDLTAQVFFLALRHASKKRQKPTNIQAWLYRIAGNEVNGYFRSMKRRPPAASLADNPEAAELQDTEARRGDKVLAQHQAFLQLSAALRALKVEDQTVLALRFFENKTFEEIADILGKRTGAVTMRAHRALDRLKGELSQRGISYEGLRTATAGSS